MLKTLYRKILNAILTVLVLIYLILDELVWERIAEPVYKFIHGLKILYNVELAIVGLNRYALLVLFLSLFAAVEGLGVVAIGLFAQGLVIPAIVLYAGKIPIAAFTFWVFKIAQEKLLTFAWFKFCYEGLMSMIHKIKASAIYLGIKAKAGKIKAWFKQWGFIERLRRIKALIRFNRPN